MYKHYENGEISQKTCSSLVSWNNVSTSTILTSYCHLPPCPEILAPQSLCKEEAVVDPCKG
jgi:hypothetical protein